MNTNDHLPVGTVIADYKRQIFELEQMLAIARASAMQNRTNFQDAQVRIAQLSEQVRSERDQKIVLEERLKMAAAKIEDLLTRWPVEG